MNKLPDIRKVTMVNAFKFNGHDVCPVILNVPVSEDSMSHSIEMSMVRPDQSPGLRVI
jgi:hypothetical protein